MSGAASTPFLGFLGRPLWMRLGPLALGGTALYIVTTGTGWLTLADLVYSVVLGVMIAGRWFEFRSGKPLTSAGEPATAEQHRRYGLSAGALGVGIWFIANFIGNHMSTT
jgi:hypothetical protein